MLELLIFNNDLFLVLVFRRILSSHFTIGVIDRVVFSIIGTCRKSLILQLIHCLYINERENKSCSIIDDKNLEQKIAITKNTSYESDNENITRNDYHNMILVEIFSRLMQN